MKKALVVTLLCFGIGAAQAVDPLSVNRSSFTLTSDAVQCIPSAHYLDSVIIANASTGGFLTIYNSTWTTTVTISSMSLATVQTAYFNNLAVKGLCYTTAANSKGVTIIYKQ